MTRLRIPFIAVAVVTPAMALAQTPAPQPPAPQTPPPARAAPRLAVVKEGPLTLHVRDLSPRFLAFWEAAQTAPDAEARFKLWKQLYGFAAVPPTPEGDAMARRLVDSAWRRYGEAVAPAQAGWEGMRPAPLPILAKVATTLGVEQPVEIELVTFVGSFDDNAYTYRARFPTVVIPLESEPKTRARILAHEGAHAIHMITSNASGGWERSVAATMLQEGVAIHVSQEVVPGQPLDAYLSHRPGWRQESQAKERVILTGLKTKLERKDSDAVSSVTVRKGEASGVEREAYYGGWRVVTQLRKDGMTLAQIARIPEAEMPAVVDKAIEALLRQR
jgi:hypothetical protein